MERVFEGDNFALVGAEFVVRILARQLQRGFVGFSTGVTEENFIGEGRLHQGFRQLQHRFVGIAVADVPQLIQLRFQRVSQRRIRMTQRVNRNAASHVNVLFTLLVPDAGARRFHRDKRRGSETRNHISIKIFASDTA